MRNRFIWKNIHFLISFKYLRYIKVYKYFRINAIVCESVTIIGISNFAKDHTVICVMTVFDGSVPKWLDLKKTSNINFGLCFYGLGLFLFQPNNFKSSQESYILI